MGGGANSRDINSVLALGGCWGENYVPRGEKERMSWIEKIREREREKERGRKRETRLRVGVGVTNQRLAIVNSTCAVKQLINKRLFTSYVERRRKAY